MKYFSAETNSFFDSEIHKSMPRDALEISNDFYRYLLSGQSSGRVISSDDSGSPILIDAPESSSLEILHDAWISQKHEVREGVVVTVRHPKFSDDLQIYQALLFNIQNGFSETEKITDVNGVQHDVNEGELIAIIHSGAEQSKQNYQIWKDAVSG
jgi:hypothetical protein